VLCLSVCIHSFGFSCIAFLISTYLSLSLSLSSLLIYLHTKSKLLYLNNVLYQGPLLQTWSRVVAVFGCYLCLSVFILLIFLAPNSLFCIPLSLLFSYIPLHAKSKLLYLNNVFYWGPLLQTWSRVVAVLGCYLCLSVCIHSFGFSCTEFLISAYLSLSFYIPLHAKSKLLYLKNVFYQGPLLQTWNRVIAVFRCYLCLSVFILLVFLAPHSLFLHTCLSLSLSCLLIYLSTQKANCFILTIYFIVSPLLQTWSKLEVQSSSRLKQEEPTNNCNSFITNNNKK